MRASDPSALSVRLRSTLTVALCALASTAPVATRADRASAGTAMERLAQRLEAVESRNRELERRLAEIEHRYAPSGDPVADASVDTRLRALEAAREQTEASLASDRISEDEPELVTRLKAIETQTLAMQKQARQIEALDGITIAAGMTSLVQRIDADGSATQKSQSRLNYRGDVAVTVPGGSLGNADGRIFTHLRFGQGNGAALRPTYTSTANTTTFEATGVQDPDSSFAILAQAWYQLDIPLPLGGYKPYSRQHLAINVGKMDPFLFFDQNVAADDETVRFANNAFVHNPLLDSGGDIGADTYGFAPGVRLAYFNETNKANSWGISFGAFGSGPAANFSGSLGRPLLIGQLDWSTRLLGGLPGNYRVYAWRNGRADDFDGATAPHGGWGISADQRVGDALTLFVRYGDSLRGHRRFDRALTLGGEIRGSNWRRSADALGIAIGSLHTDPAFRDATSDGSLVGYNASGSEQIAEIYYRLRLNDHIEITPDLQWVHRPGGDRRAPDSAIFGLRAQVGF